MLFAQALGLVAAPPVRAADVCPTSGTTVTCTYSFTGAEQTFTVPAGVTAVQVTAIGGAGGKNDPLQGGGGAIVQALLVGLDAGQVLYIEVGGNGGVRSAGFNGGGPSTYGFGGGGASDVRTASRTTAGTLASRLLVAGGGGGTAEYFHRDVGDGGDAGMAGEGEATASSGGGGQPGTATAGGAGGAGANNSEYRTGGAGTLGQGGRGSDGWPSAGGGGGGLYGGGGGGGGNQAYSNYVTAAGGGGGGSSLVPAGGTLGLDDTRTPQIAVSYTGVPVDTTPPAITITTPTDGVTYKLNQVVHASYRCDDGSGSGVASCVGSVPDGAAIDTTSVGQKTFTVTATDNAGNTVETHTRYSVTYAFSGFSTPVDNGNVLNVAKAGQVIPLKWRLTDANGAPVTTLSGIKLSVSSFSCATGTTSDAVEEYAAGESGLQNLGNGYYQFNWKSPKTYAGSCKTLKLDLGEGANQERTALFQFR